MFFAEGGTAGHWLSNSAFWEHCLWRGGAGLRCQPESCPENHCGEFVLPRHTGGPAAGMAASQNPGLVLFVFATSSPPDLSLLFLDLQQVWLCAEDHHVHQEQSVSGPAAVQRHCARSARQGRESHLCGKCYLMHPWLSSCPMGLFPVF